MFHSFITLYQALSVPLSVVYNRYLPEMDTCQGGKQTLWWTDYVTTGKSTPWGVLSASRHYSASSMWEQAYIPDTAKTKPAASPRLTLQLPSGHSLTASDSHATTRQTYTVKKTYILRYCIYHTELPFFFLYPPELNLNVLCKSTILIIPHPIFSL